MNCTFFRDCDGWQELKSGEYYPESLRPNKSIQIYRREQDLHFGSSRVVKVSSGDSSQKYVLKLPSVSNSVEPNKNEARILKALNQKEKGEGKIFLIQLLALFAIREDPVMMFPFYSSNLGSLIREFPRGLSIQATLSITKQMLKIADFLDRNQLIHRDIKPGNFLIDQKGRIKLCDFGLAFFKKDRERVVDLEGSVHYMAPELFSWNGVGDPPYDTSSDMWGLGCTVYKTVSGVSLFPNSSEAMAVVEVVWQQECLLMDGAEDPFKQTMESVAISKPSEDAGALIQILKGLLQFDPKRRLTPKAGLEFIRGCESPQVIEVRGLIDKKKK